MFLWSIAAALFVATSTALAIDVERLDDPGLQQRYERLLDDYTCDRCRNTTLRENYGLETADVRRTIRRMLVSGRTDREIHEQIAKEFPDRISRRASYSGGHLGLWAMVAVTVLAASYIYVRVLVRHGGGPSPGRQV